MAFISHSHKGCLSTSAGWQPHLGLTWQQNGGQGQEKQRQRGLGTGGSHSGPERDAGRSTRAQHSRASAVLGAEPRALLYSPSRGGPRGGAAAFPETSRLPLRNEGSGISGASRCPGHAGWSCPLAAQQPRNFRTEAMRVGVKGVRVALLLVTRGGIHSSPSPPPPGAHPDSPLTTVLID